MLQSRYGALMYNSQLNTAYVATNGNDLTAVVGRKDKKFATINAALDALPSTGGIIRVGLGTFTPVDLNKWKDNISLIGSGQPELNATGTGLIGGTIVQGPLIRINKNNTIIKNLGVDSGSAVCTALYAGVAQEGLLVLSTGAEHVLVTPNTGVVVKDITVVVKDPLSAVHCFLCEGVDGAVVDNIKTYWGQHGIVFKSINSIGSNLHSYGASVDGLIIRDSPYARCNNNTFSNVILGNKNGNIGTGLILDASDAGMELYGNTISNVVCNGTSYLIKLNSNAASNIHDNNMFVLNAKISDVTIIGNCNDNTLNGNKIDVKTPTLLNGATNVGGGNSIAKYYKEGNKVYLEGTIQTYTVGLAILTLPIGYRSPVNLRYSVPTDTTVTARLFVGSNGDVSIEAGAAAWFTMDGVSFRI